MRIAHHGARGHVAVDHVLPSAIRKMTVCDDMASSCRPPQRWFDALPRHDIIGGKFAHPRIVRNPLSASKCPVRRHKRQRPRE